MCVISPPTRCPPSACSSSTLHLILPSFLRYIFSSFLLPFFPSLLPLLHPFILSIFPSLFSYISSFRPSSPPSYFFIFFFHPSSLPSFSPYFFASDHLSLPLFFFPFTLPSFPSFDPTIPPSFLTLSASCCRSRVSTVSMKLEPREG